MTEISRFLSIHLSLLFDLGGDQSSDTEELFHSAASSDRYGQTIARKITCQLLSALLLSFLVRFLPFLFSFLFCSPMLTGRNEREREKEAGEIISRRK